MTTHALDVDQGLAIRLVLTVPPDAVRALASRIADALAAEATATPKLPADTRPEQSPRPLLWTVRDVATALQVSQRHVLRLCASGQLPRPMKLGQLVRWDAETIRRWIAGQGRCGDEGAVDSA